MKYLAATSYALAVAGGSGALLNSFMLGLFTFAGVIFTLLAIERIVQDAVKPVRSSWKPVHLSPQHHDALGLPTWREPPKEKP